MTCAFPALPKAAARSAIHAFQMFTGTHLDGELSSITMSVTT